MAVSDSTRSSWCGSSLRISAATGNGFRNAPVPAIPDSDFERGMVALRKHCETALRPGPVYEKVNMYVLHKMTARRFVGSQAESVGLFRPKF